MDMEYPLDANEVSLTRSSFQSISINDHDYFGETDYLSVNYQQQPPPPPPPQPKIELMNSSKLIETLPIPLLLINIKPDRDDFIFSGVANTNLTSRLECTSEQLVDSIIRMPTPPTSPILNSCNSSPINSINSLSSINEQHPQSEQQPPKIQQQQIVFTPPPLSLSSGGAGSSFNLQSSASLTPTSNCSNCTNTINNNINQISSLASPSISSSSAINTLPISSPTLQSTSQQTQPPFRTSRRPSSHMRFIISRFDPIISIDNKCTYEKMKSTSATGVAFEDRQFESVVECIHISFEEKKPIKQNVLMNNLVTKQQFKAVMVVTPFIDGCSCIFESIEEVVDEPDLLEQPNEFNTPTTSATSLLVPTPILPNSPRFNNLELNQTSSNPSSLSSATTPISHYIYPAVRHQFEILSFIMAKMPSIVWRCDISGELFYFKKMGVEEYQCEGNSIEDFLHHVHPRNQSSFIKQFNVIKKESTNNIEFVYWYLLPDKSYMLYVFRGSPVRDIKGKIIGWVGSSYSFVMNEGSVISVKSQVNLDSMYLNFKELYEQQNSKAHLCLDLDNISLGSFEHFIEQKKLVLSEEDRTTFQKCRDTYNILFRLSLLGVMFSTLKGAVMDANDALLSIIGYTRSDLEQGKVDWMLITPPEYFEISARALQELKAKRWCQPIEKAYVHKNGQKVPVLITAAMVDGSDEQCITFVFDLSRYRQAEESAIKATKLKSQFIANISHELRTPCHGILGMTQLLLDSGLTPNQRDSAETIKRSMDGLINLINDILDFSKIEAGKLVLEIAEFELVSVVEEVINLQGEMANKKGIDLIFIVGRESPVPPVLYGDSRFIRQVLLNLVHNALKFTEKGHVVLEISTEYESGDQVSLKFSVKDTGIGIPESSIDQLFLPFSQIDGSASRKHGGSGLGLSICRDLVRLMGGNISFESKVGKGSCFWFSLKLLVAAPSYLPSSVPAANQFFYPEFNQFSKDRKKVLVVEPHQKLRMSIHSMLNTINFDSIETNTMETAIEIFNIAKSSGTPFEVVIFSDTCTSIKPMLDKISSERVIVYGRDYRSSWSEHPLIASYLLKPIRYTKLISAITRRLSNASQQTLSSNSSNGGLLKMDIDPLGVAIERKDKKCILVAEDNDVNIKVIVRQLDKLGFYPIVGCNGKKVLEILTNTQDCQFSLILMDCQMPELDGFTCSKVIRELEHKDQRIPIIAMTANSKPTAEEQCKLAGMDDYLAKPVKIDSLKNTLAKWLPKNEDPKYFFYPLSESPTFMNNTNRK